MRIAYTISETPGLTDQLLSDLAGTLSNLGCALAGVVQTNSKRCDQDLCDMDLKVLPDGAVTRISQSLGKGSRGCRLDPGALETAVADVAATLEGADILILNKFGKHESDGRGFRPVIAEALARDIPMVLGVSKLSHTAFRDFVGGAAEFVAPDAAAMLAWVDEARASAERACASAPFLQSAV